MGQGISAAGTMPAGAAEIIIGSVPHALRSEADEDRPIISGELPTGGHRSVLPRMRLPCTRVISVDMARLLKSTMRFRPDRIVGGEVRDGPP
jgi:Flp pilus assembly CpaF family ATPase